MCVGDLRRGALSPGRAVRRPGARHHRPLDDGYLDTRSLKQAMKVLITGATGFMGTRLAAAALERGDSVRGLVRDLDRAADLRALGVETVQGDMLENDSLRRAVQGVDCIFHTAAVIGDWPDRALSRR